MAAAAVGLATLAGPAALVAMAPPAAAHAELLATDPADGAVVDVAPERVTLTFNEPVQLREGGVTVFDAAGDELPVTGTSRDEVVTVTLPDLGDGTYIVSWRVISLDTHPVAGGFTFSVGRPSATVADIATDADQSTENVLRGVQALTYAGLLVAAGLVVFEVVLAPPGVAALRTRWRRVAGASIAVAVVGSALLLPLTSIRQGGGDLSDLARSQTWTDQLDADPGLTAILVVAGLTAAMVATARPVDGSRVRAAAALGGVGAALGSVALVGHTRTFGPTWLVLPSDLLHVATAACWLGGLVALGIVLSARAGVAPAADATLAVARFSALAAGLVTVLGVAGVVLGWRVVGSWSALFGTNYGVTLLVKVAVVAIVLAVAARNRYRLLPRIRAESEAASAWVSLRRAIRLEAVLLTAIVATTGILVSQSPVEEAAADPPAAQPQGQTLTGELGEGTATASLSPGGVGVNSLVLTLTAADGSPLVPIREPEVSVTHPEAGIGPLTRPVTNTGPGRYEASVDLPLPGVWELQVSVRVSQFENPLATLPVEVR